jgi:hypothetical protein
VGPGAIPVIGIWIISDEHFPEISPLGDATAAGAIAPKNVNKAISYENQLIRSISATCK